MASVPSVTRERETFLAPFAVAAIDADKGTYKGLATVFDREFLAWDPTRYELIPTVIHKGAFAKTLAENGQRIKILYQHEDNFPIGKPIALAETDTGLEIEAWLDREQRPQGMNPYSLLKNGIVDEQSIGFVAVKTEYDFDEQSRPIRRHLREVKLDEISLVTWGANSASKVTEVQSRAPGDETIMRRFVEIFRQSDESAANLLAGVIWVFAEQHAGKVLSAKNKQLVEDAIVALKALIAAAEPPPADDSDKEDERRRALTAERHEAEIRLVELIGQLKI